MLLLLPMVQVKDDLDAKLKEFADSMRTAKTDPGRLAAIDVLAATRHSRAAAKIVQVVAGPYSAAVRAGAADAVGRIGDVKAGQGLQGILGSFGGLLSSENPNRPDDQKTAEAVVRALGALRDRSAVRQLTNLLISNNIALMGAAVRALAQIRDLSCMGDLLKLHYAANAPEGVGAQNVRKPLAPDTLAALRRITGQSLTTPDEWNKWWRTSGGAFRQPPEESLGGLSPAIRSFAVYAGKGEVPALSKYDLVLLDPANYTKEELKGLKAVALLGDPKAAMDKGFAGIVVAAEEAADVRKKFPAALIVVRGDPSKA
ncbi:MAG TPA: HEAT repeat domain-containing protein, partial [Planctomycetota bacterium]|nr:HEAT repeat domain-containing protein [Planctomycetota bacterium]